VVRPPTKSLAAALVLATVALTSIPAAGSAAGGRGNERAPSRDRSIEVRVVERGGFHWADAGVGALAAFGLILLLGGVAVVLRGARQVPHRREKVMRKSTFLGTVAVLAIAFAAPAVATPPVAERFTDSAAEPVPCDGFDALLERHFSGTVRTYLDNEGTPIRMQVTARMAGSVTSSVTGKQVLLRGRIQLAQDLITGTTGFTGPVFMATDRGRGVVIQDTGRIVFDADGNVVLEAGPHDAVDLGAQIFCDAVS
jgi:hypothetical protein